MVSLPTYIEQESVYARNIRSIWQNWPELAQEIENVRHERLVNCVASRSGVPTCQMEGARGTLIYLHSQYDPRREAEKWADGVIGQAQEQRDKNEDRMPMGYAVSGFGLGYHIRALFDRLAGETFIAVSENNLGLLKTALFLQDFSEELESRRLVIITASDREELFKKIEGHGPNLMMGMVFTHSLPAIDGDFHQQVRKLLSEYASFLRSHMISLLANSMVTVRNILNNLPTYVGTPSIRLVKNRFAGYPAVVVSAGPSLQKNINLLKEIRDQVVVIAVQTTLKPLLANGIRPDFVTSLDYHEASSRFFEGLDAELRDIHLVAEPKASWHVIDRYRGRGPISLLSNVLIDLLLGNLSIDHDGMNAGATVAHLAFYLAVYCGADPVIFVGQDLGFSDHVYYSPGNALHEVWDNELNRFGTLEMKEWERIVRHRHMLRKVTDIHGQEIYTDEQMYTYLQQFEKDFGRSTVKIIDASEGGVRKQNTAVMTLRQAVDQYCHGPLPRALFDYREKMALFDPSRLEETRDEIKRKMETVRELMAISQETAALTQAMLRQVDNQDEIRRNMVRLDELRTQVKHRESAYNLVRSVAQIAEMNRHRMDRTLDVEGLTGVERQRRQLQRDVTYVSEIAKGCERMLGLMEECLPRFDPIGEKA